MQNRKSPTKTDKTRQRRKPGIESEKKLLDAANVVFWENGFSGSTIMQIVNTSGLSVGSFYHRFDGKEDLLEAALSGAYSDFTTAIHSFDFSQKTNQNLYTLFVRLAVAGRSFVARNRGIYRATSEIAKSDFKKFGSLSNISTNLEKLIANEIVAYENQLGSSYQSEQIGHAVQLLTMTTMQSELGMGPLFPEEIHEYAAVIARAMCGVLNYSDETIFFET